MEKKVDNPSLIRHEINEKKTSKKKITIDVDEDDPCLKKVPEDPQKGFKFSPIGDPRYII